MPQDGTLAHGVRDMDLEDTVVHDGGSEEEKGCLETLALLPFIGMIYFFVRIWMPG